MNESEAATPGLRDIGNTTTGREKQRSRTGCRTCRSRKVKCDERPGGCGNCARLNLLCPNAAGRPDGSAAPSPESRSETTGSCTEAGIRRSRTYRSCKACRASKSRCSGDRPTCVRCQQRDVECAYDGKQAPAWLEAAAPLYPENEHDLPHQDVDASPSLLGHSPDRAGSSQGVRSAAINQVPNALSWLFTNKLPGKDKIATLAEEYFSHMHSYRSFGFIHKPSFMQELDDRPGANSGEDVLLYVVCALGAKFYTLKTADRGSLMEGLALRAGTQWADRALHLLVTNLNRVSVEGTMAVVLLHEHELRVGKYASALMLTGLAVRMAQSLQINLEYSTDILCSSKEGLSVASRESRRRLMWAIYVMDAWVGSGVDELTLVQEPDLKIQLPCTERNFAFQMPSVVETLQPKTFLPFIPPELHAASSSDSLDLPAYFIRLISLRRKVLRFVKHLDTAKPPWQPQSEFLQLEFALQQWYDDLPPSLSFSRSALYMRKDTGQLGATLFLHLCFHQTGCDLNRIGMGKLFKIRDPIDFPPDQAGFVKRVQDQCFGHAMTLSLIFDEAVRYGDEALSDTWYSVVAHDSLRVIVHYVSSGLGSSREHSQQSGKRQANTWIQPTILALKKMVPMYALAKPLYEAAIRMVKSGGLEIPESFDTVGSDQDVAMPEAEVDNAGKPVQFTPEYVLNPLSLYRMARKDIEETEKHAPERTSSSSPPTGTAPTQAVVPVMSYPDLDDTTVSTIMSTRTLDPAMNMAIDDLQLPTSIDDLQTYLNVPVTFNGYDPHFTTGFASDVEMGGTSFPVPQPPADMTGDPSDYGSFAMMDPRLRWP